MEKRKIKQRIAELKRNLKDTDYLALKCVEGELSIADYTPIKEQRRQWRAEINSLEVKLKG